MEKCSGMFAYLRLSSLNRRKKVEGSPLISRAAALGLRLVGRRRAGSRWRLSQTLAMCGMESPNGEQYSAWVPATGATETVAFPFSLAKDAGPQRLWTLSSCYLMFLCVAAAR